MKDEIKKYFESNAVNQTLLKSLLNGVHSFKKLEENELFYEEKESLIIGSGVDCIITEGLDEFKNQYYLFEGNKPSDTIMSIINEVYQYKKDNNIETNDLNNYDDIIHDITVKMEYQPTYKRDTRLNKIKEHSAYWQSLIDSEDKIIIDYEQCKTIWNVVLSLLTHKHTKDYFIPTNSKGISYQTPIYFKFQDLECKALIDMMIVDYENKTIQVIDIKTLGDYTNNFINNVRKFRYDIQAAFYFIGVLEHIKNSEYKDFKLLDFKFIVESTKAIGCPLVYTLLPNDIHIAIHGLKPYQIGYDHQLMNLKSVMTIKKEVKGIFDAIELYKWYRENHSEMIYDKEVIENNGELNLNVWLEPYEKQNN